MSPHSCGSVSDLALAIACLIMLLATPMTLAQSTPSTKNILLIINQATRGDIGLKRAGLQGPSTPNIDAFASGAVTFNNAYHQDSLSGPARNSVLVSRYPTALGIYNLNDAYRNADNPRSDWRTLPEFFKTDLQYPVVSYGGKVFHDDPGLNQDFPRSWTQSFYPSLPALQNCIRDWLTPTAQRLNLTLNQVASSNPYFQNTQICPDSNPNATYNDILMAKAMAKELQRVGANSSLQPFFLAAGFTGLGNTMHIPSDMFQKYLAKEFATIQSPDPPTGVGPGWTSYVNLPCQGFVIQAPPERNWLLTNYSGQNVTVPNAWFRAAYFAAIENFDRAFGIIMQQLNSLPAAVVNNTIVVLTSDTGFKLGEHDGWCGRMTTDSDSTALLMIKPGTGRKGRTTSALFEMVDLYPTVVSLAGGKSQLSGLSGQIQGVDQSALIWGPTPKKTPAIKTASVTITPYCADGAFFYFFTDLPNSNYSNYNYTLPDKLFHDGCNRRARSAVSAMTFSIRTQMYRLTSTVAFNGTLNTITGSFDHPISEQLYAHPQLNQVSLVSRAQAESVSVCNSKAGCKTPTLTKQRNSLRAALKQWWQSIMS